MRSNKLDYINVYFTSYNKMGPEPIILNN